MQTIREVLSDRELFFVDENQSVAGAARRMAFLNVGAIIVLRGNQLRGIFSERDLMTRVVVEGLDPSYARVSEVMTSNPTTISDDATIDEAMDTMRRIGCRHLPVLRGDSVAGLISMRDLMHVELERKTEELLQMRAYIHGSA
jgi:signal-transduction protein with cAMP-binding, CBS, and nucleotidyltransferase domain